MNWYKWVKTAQLWSVEPEYEGLAGSLQALYELEYKWSMIRSRPFNGMEKRQENIIRGLEKNLNAALEEVKDPLIKTYIAWLRSHAITDPNEWAASRVRDSFNLYEEEYDYPHANEYALQSVIGEYIRYNYPTNYGFLSPGQATAQEQKAIREIGNLVDQHIAGMPKTQEMLQSFTEGFSHDEREMFDWDEFETEEEAQSAYDAIGDDSKTFSEFLDWQYDGTVHQIANSIAQWGDLRGVMQEINQVIVFPQWFHHWEAEGIEETRNRVEKTFEQLQKVPTGELGKDIATVNAALNEAHQNGDMLDYIKSYGGDYSEVDKDLLDELSNADTSEWDAELRAAGVQI